MPAGASLWQCSEQRLRGSLIAVDMAIFSLLSRLSAYYAHHGFEATIRRASLALKRAVFSNRMVLFHCDLAMQTTAPACLPTSLKVECLRSLAELSPRDLGEMTSFWNPEQARQNIEERFEKGAALWLIKSGERLAGYGWTIQGHTMEPYFFPLGKDDVHLFDYCIFPRYRGRGLNPLLVAHILNKLVAEGGCCQAFIEAAEWNEAQLSSLRKTPFRCLGKVRKLTLFGHSFVRWADRASVEKVLNLTGRKDEALPVARER
jgi:ribosomal protein S18 acetylase RimI-like enzyme